jgi:CheY-like chemotaxis protein
MPGHVMVVEDDLDIRESLVDSLEDDGHAVIPAINGRDALDKLRNTVVRPCLILLDVMMPVMDGRTFRELQLKMPELSGIPVVLISAYQTIEDLARELQAVGYLKKPLKLSDLRSFTDRFCAPTAC